MRHYSCPEEFVAFRGTELSSAWLRVVLRELGQLQEPQQAPPKHPWYDDAGWVQLPPGWEERELPAVRVVFRRLAPGARHPAIQFTIVPDKRHLGQQQFEDIVATQLPGRLTSPYVGKIRVELWVGKHRKYAIDHDVAFAWSWPLKEAR